VSTALGVAKTVFVILLCFAAVAAISLVNRGAWGSVSKEPPPGLFVVCLKGSVYKDFNSQNWTASGTHCMAEDKVGLKGYADTVQVITGAEASP
jgi:hypothetical protein